MKKRIHLLALFAALACSASAFAGPKLEFNEREFTFGQIPPQSIVSHTFWAYSTGDAPLVIDTVITGCGCTSIPLEKKIIPPGDSVALEMWFSSKGFRGRVAKRPTVKLIGDTTKYQLKFYATVVHEPKDLFPLAALPPIFNFSQATEEEKYENKFALQNRAKEDVAVSIVAQNENILDITAPDTLRAGELWEGWVSLKPDKRGASFVTSVTFEVNNSPMNRLTIPIVGRPPETKLDSLKFDFSKPSPLDE